MKMVDAIAAAPRKKERSMGELFQSEPDALRFGGPQDAINFARDGIKDANRRASFDAIELVKCYNEGKVHICVKLAARVGFGDYDLILFAVEGRRFHSNAAAEYSLSDVVSAASNTDWHQEAMFIGVTELVEGPEGVIPSFMRLERAKERADFRRQVLAPPLGVRIKFDGGITKGKAGVLGLDDARADGDGIPALIQRRSQGFDCLNSGIGPTIGDFAVELKRMGRDALRVCLSDRASWFVFEESCDTLFKPTNLSLRCLDGA